MRMAVAPSSAVALTSRTRRFGSSTTGMTATAGRERATLPFSGLTPGVISSLTSRWVAVLATGSEKNSILRLGYEVVRDTATGLSSPCAGSSRRIWSARALGSTGRLKATSPLATTMAPPSVAGSRWAVSRVTSKVPNETGKTSCPASVCVLARKASGARWTLYSVAGAKPSLASNRSMNGEIQVHFPGTAGVIAAGSSLGANPSPAPVTGRSKATSR